MRQDKTTYGNLGQSRTIQDNIRQYMARQFNTKRDKTILDNIRRAKTRQAKTIQYNKTTT